MRDDAAHRPGGRAGRVGEPGGVGEEVTDLLGHLHREPQAARDELPDRVDRLVRLVVVIVLLAFLPATKEEERKEEEEEEEENRALLAVILSAVVRVIVVVVVVVVMCILPLYLSFRGRYFFLMWRFCFFFPSETRFDVF